MYDLPYHKESDRQVIDRFVRDNPFAVLTGSGSNTQPVATQVPLLVKEVQGRYLLRGHLMRGTDHHEAFGQNHNVLAIFTGSQAYVSGAWYSDPHTPSTWNYMSVHARGTIRFLDTAALVQILRETTLLFEKGDTSSPTIYDNLPGELKRRLLQAIVAFEITVTTLDTVFKLSQDRDPESFLNIIAKLKERGEDARKIAMEMEKRMEDVIPSNHP